MKFTRTYVWILVLTISIVFSGCSKEELVISNQLAESENADNQNDENTDNDTGNEVGEQGEITLYRVNGEEIEKIKDYKVTGEDLNYQKDIARHQEIWELTKKIFPPNYRIFMSEFMIYNGEVSGSAGYVYPTENNLSKWQMGIAINYADDQRELVYTLIHEFGHILTLNDTQVDAAISENDCTNYFVGEGCAKTTSYINESHKKYWADIWSEFQTAQESETAHQEFYEKYQDRFVTNYAATNPGEDIAEVFATFVTRNTKPAGDGSIAEEKILLLYEHPEIIELRDYIRNNTTSTAKSGGQSLLPAPGSWKKATTLGNSRKPQCRLKH